MFKARIGSDFDRVIHRVFPFLRRLPVHPDVLSIAGVLASLGAGVAFALESPRVGALVLAVAGLCDLLDGALARAQGRSSSAGAFMDSTLDRISELAAFAGIAAAFAGQGRPGGVVLAMWALGASFLTSYTRARAESRLARFHVGFMERAERLCVLILGAFVGFLELALWVVAIGATATTLQRIAVARRLLRELDRTGRDPTAAPSPAD